VKATAGRALPIAPWLRGYDRAWRSANLKILASVDQHPATDVLVLDATALAQLSITVIEQVAELERELGDRGVTQGPAHRQADPTLAGARPGRPALPHRRRGRARVPGPLTAACGCRRQRVAWSGFGLTCFAGEIRLLGVS
jgi:hypothetical protein